MKQHTRQDWFDVVARTAAHGLADQRSDKQQFHKWLAVWGMGLVGEIQEAIDVKEDGEQESLFCVECGDVFWYLAANTMLLTDLGAEVYNLQTFPSDCGQMLTLRRALSIAIARLEMVKKIIRDDRPVDAKTISDLLDLQRFVYLLMMQACDFNQAIAAVESKLLKRYPNGYMAESSINRAT